MAKRVGITKRLGWHTFRNTYSTLLRANGEDIKVVQELLRHAALAAQSHFLIYSLFEKRSNPPRRPARWHHCPSADDAVRRNRSSSNPGQRSRLPVVPPELIQFALYATIEISSINCGRPASPMPLPLWVIEVGKSAKWQKTVSMYA